MALRKVGVIFTAQGHAQYMSELKQVNQEMRTMSTQAKLAVAQLGNNASTTDTYKTKMKSMGAEIQVSGNRTKMLTDLQKNLGIEQKRLPGMIEETTKKYKDSNKTTKDLKKSYEDLAKAKGVDADETKEAEKAYKSSIKQTAALKKEMKELEVVYAQNGKQLEKLPNDIARSNLKTQEQINLQQKLHSEYRNSGGALTDVAKGWQDFGTKVTGVGDQMQQTGNYMTTRFTLPIVAGFGAAIKTGLTFDQQMRQTAAIAGMTTDDLTVVGGAYEQLRGQAIQLGADSIFGATDVALAQEMMASAGFEVIDIMSAIPGVMDLAAISGKDMGLASEAVAVAMNQFGLEASQSTHVADVFARAAADTNAETTDMAHALQYAGTVAGAVGWNFEQTAAAIGIMSNAGVKGSQAGTTLRGVVSRLAKPSKQASEAMEDIGFSAYDAEGKMKQLSQIIPDLRSSFEGMTNEQKENAIVTIFGQEALAGMLALINSAPGEFDALTGSLKNSEGAAASMAEVINSGANGAIEQLMGSLETLSISLFDNVAPSLISIVDGITGAVESFGELDEGTQKAIIQGVLFVAAAGPIISVLGKITSASGKVITGVGDAIKLIGKWTTPKAITDTATELGKIPGAAGKAGGAAALFSNPWVIGGAVAIAGVSAFVAYMNHQANLPFAKHQEAVDETNGAYQEWFDGVTSGIGTIEELSQSAIEGATATSEAYLQALEDIRGANVDTQENLDKMFGDNFFGGNRLNYFEGEMFSQFRLEIDNITGAMQRLGATESEIAKVQQAFNNYGTLLTGTSNEVLRLYQEEQVVTADWALSQTRAVDTVTQSVVAGLRERQEARKANLDAQLEGNYITQQVYQQEISNLNSYTEQAVSSIQTSTQSIKEIFANASRENRTLQENELLSFTKSLANISKITGESLSENQEIMKMLGDNMSFLSSEVMVEWMRGEEIMSDSMIKMFKNAGSTEEALGILVDALDAYGAKEIKPKEAYVETEEAKADLLELTDLANQWNELTFEERLAQVETRGKEEIEALLELLGVDWENLTPEQKRYYAEAEGGEALENILYLTQEWNRQTDPQKKFAILETQIDSEALLGAIKARDLWNDADFMSLAMEIDTNAPDAKEQLVNLVNYFSEQKGLAPLQMETEALTEESQQKLAELIATYTGAPVDEVLEFLTDTNADDTTASIEGTGQALNALGGRSATVTVNAIDNASGIIASIGRGLSGLNGFVATTYVDTVARGRKGFATGGHIDAYAEGGNIQYAGMFASGGNVPKGYSGIVGEAGAEIFTVTDRGVSITPLNSSEKMRGVGGAVADEVSRQLGGSGGINLTINIDKPVVSNKDDMKKLANEIIQQANKTLGQQTKNKQKGRST